MQLQSVEVFSLKLAHLQVAEVFTQRLELERCFDVAHSHPYRAEEGEPNQVAVQIGLGLDVGRVLNAPASAEKLLSIKS